MTICSEFILYIIDQIPEFRRISYTALLVAGAYIFVRHLLHNFFYGVISIQGSFECGINFVKHDLSSLLRILVQDLSHFLFLCKHHLFCLGSTIDFLLELTQRYLIRLGSVFGDQLFFLCWCICKL